MNSAFGGYEELSRSRPSASVDNTLRNLLNSSYPTQPRSLIANYIYLFIYLYLYRICPRAAKSSDTWCVISPVLGRDS